MKYLILNNERILKHTGLVRALSVNFILLLAHLLFKDAQFTLCTGVWLMFLFSYLANPILRIGSLAGLFLLSIFPFILFIYFRHSQVYFDGISWDSFYAIYPYLSVFLIAVFISFIIGVLIQKLIKSPKIKQRIIFSLTALTFAILSGSQGWAFQFSFIGFIYFFAVLLYKGSSLKDRLILSLFLLLPYLGLFGPFILFDSLVHVYPFLVIPILSIAAALLCLLIFRNSKKILASALVLFYLVFLVLGYWGMKNYLQFAFGLNDSPFVKEIKFDFYNSTDDSYTNKEIEGKTTVIYFHTKTCSVCYKKLPELESLYHEFKSDTNIVIVAAFLPYNTFEDTSFIFNFHRKLKYSYPQYISRESANIYEERFNIDGYPHVTIIGKEGNIIHNGLFNNDPMVFVNNARLFILDDN
jgi:thiol-disulfide isomerase/thioredoxin